MTSKFDFEYCLLLLKENDETVEKEAREILSKMCDNIIKCPNEVKYRKVRIGNSVVEKKLMPAIGAIECLFAAGFIENDDGFLLPLESSLTGVKELKKLLITTDIKQDIPTPKPKPETSDTTKNEFKAPSQPIVENNEKASTSTACKKNSYSQKCFFEKIINNFKSVLRYEDPQLQEKIKHIVPIDRLEYAAMENLRQYQKEAIIQNAGKSGKIVPNENNFTMQDWLLLELLHWFKHEFFEWVNNPKCNLCDSDSTYFKEQRSSDIRISRIEVYKCNTCNNIIEFPRYSDPEPLLRTRGGRCGEWANVFTLICRTLGYDARFISDETDHVWTEVWSISQNRWIHLDPCEEAMDTPLMYEKGWGKKLTYIFAFSKDEMQDVTWRYTADQKSVMRRRKKCSEESIVLLMKKLNEQRINTLNYSNTRKNYIIKRRLKELIDMLPAPPGKKKPSEENEDVDYQGRTSGSLAWRLTRGEIKNDPLEAHIWHIPNACNTFTLNYNILTDTYVIVEESDERKVYLRKCWQSGIDDCKGGIFYKTEYDWGRVYLARSSDYSDSDGSIKWTFQSSGQNVVESIQLHAICATFEQGTVHWKVDGYFEKSNVHKTIAIPDSSNFQTRELDGASKISITAILGGDTNWQHAQLFRCDLPYDDVNYDEINYSMIIKINLRNNINEKN